MDAYETETVDEVADEVAQIARTAMDAIDRISRSTCDPASIQAARLSLGAVPSRPGGDVRSSGEYGQRHLERPRLANGTRALSLANSGAAHLYARGKAS